MSGGTFTVTGLSASEPTGQRVFGPETITGNQVIGETLAVPLSLGDNTFTVPAGSVAAWIQAPVNGTATLLLRTNLNSSPDLGLPINGTGFPIIYPFPLTPPSTLIINASGAVSAPTSIVFI